MNTSNPSSGEGFFGGLMKTFGLSGEKKSTNAPLKNGVSSNLSNNAVGTLTQPAVGGRRRKSKKTRKAQKKRKGTRRH